MIPPTAEPTAMPAMAPVESPLPDEAGRAVWDDERVSADVIGANDDVKVEVPTTMTVWNASQ